MKPVVAILAAALIWLPPGASAEAEGRSLEQRLETLRDEAGTLLRGLIDELEPHLDAIGPQLRALAEQLGGLAAYHPPELLPNGDIILRRRQPSDTTAPESPEPDPPPPEFPAPDDRTPKANGNDSSDPIEL